MQITASQHIFSNVPKEQSPMGHRGFQTISYSRSGISQADLTILENRSQYIAGEQEIIKYQYYTLPDEKVVISRTVPLPEPDEFGRRGRYLTHNLIITTMEFASTEYCPLGFIQNKNFISRVEDAFGNVNQDKGNVPSKIIEGVDVWQDRALQVARFWPEDQLMKLARIGWQATQLQKNKRGIRLIGSTQQILETLAIIFLLTAPQKRSKLTFDTFVNGCDWSRDWPFWVWGDEKADQGNKYIVIDTANHHVDAELLSNEDTPYENWIATQSIPNKLENFNVHRNPALQLDMVIQGKQISNSLLINIEPAFVADFARINSKAISEKIITSISGLSNQLVSDILSTIKTNPQNYLQWLVTGVNKTSLAELFYQLILKNVKYPLTPSDRKILGNLAKESHYPGLESLLQLNKGDTTAWKKFLELLDVDAYKTQVSSLLDANIVTASEAFLPSRLQIWCELSTGHIKSGELKSILDQIDRNEKLYPVNSLAVLWSDFSPNDKQLLRRWIKSYKGYAPQLHRFFDTHVEQSESVYQKLKSVFTGKNQSGKQKDENDR